MFNVNYIINENSITENKHLLCNITGVVAVSYTHLDVYKRQVKGSGQIENIKKEIKLHIWNVF